MGLFSNGGQGNDDGKMNGNTNPKGDPEGRLLRLVPNPLTHDETSGPTTENAAPQ